MPWPQDPDLPPPDPHERRGASIGGVTAVLAFVLLFAGLFIKNWFPAAAVVG